MDTGILDQIVALGKEAANALIAELKGEIPLDPREQGIVERAAQELAAGVVLMIGADEQRRAEIVAKMRISKVTLEAIGLAHRIKAETRLIAISKDLLQATMKIALTALVSL